MLRKFPVFFVRALLSVALPSTPIHASDVPDAVSDAWTVVGTDQLTWYPRPRDVRVDVPPEQSATREATVTVSLGIPSGCYKAVVRVEHRTDYRHVLIPMLEPDDRPCVPMSRDAIQTVRLGFLAPGDHEIVVVNGAQPATSVTFNVSDREALEARGHS
jgi:hypothetical protein